MKKSMMLNVIMTRSNIFIVLKTVEIIFPKQDPHNFNHTHTLSSKQKCFFGTPSVTFFTKRNNKIKSLMFVMSTLSNQITGALTQLSPGLDRILKDAG